MLRRLGVLDLTLITIGAVIGSGIFRTPAVVATRAHSPSLIVLCWVFGGLIALIGAFVFAELAARRPVDGGLYAYLRDAYNPLVAFLLAWQLMLLSYVGSTALSAVLFADYLLPLTGLNLPTRPIAVFAIAGVTLVNVLGVRGGTTWQNVLVALKVLGIGCVIAGGLAAHPLASHAAPAYGAPLAARGILAALGAAMLPVLFSYNNFQSTAYMTAETLNPARNIPRGLVTGVVAIVAIYLLANAAYLHVLGAGALARTATPATDVMRVAFGAPGEFIVAAAIAASTLGFLSNAVLLAPRVYFQIAADGLFFKQVAWISPATRVPVIAIALHGAISAIVAASGSYEQILNWISAWTWLFTILAAFSIFIYRRRDAGKAKPSFLVPLHPWSTLLLCAAILAVMIASFAQYPLDTAVGALVMLAGVAFYLVWVRNIPSTAIRKPRLSVPDAEPL